jgi:hypothetical protein
MLDISQENIKKEKLVYLNINPNTHPERHLVLNKFKDKSYVTYDKPIDLNIKNDNDFNLMLEGRKKFLRCIKQHHFVLCPRGNGIDTHRLWETLYLGSIPIVIYNDMYVSMLDLPILFINDWDEISEEFLNNKLNFMMNKKYNIDKLFTDYWFELIINKCQ